MNAPAPKLTVRTTCPYCGVGCGVLAEPDGKGGAGISGDTQHPANFGRLCSKGSALGETLSLEGRLLHPMIRGADGALVQASWDDALAQVATRFQNAIAKHGLDSVAFYVSGQLLTEDYYVANKLMKGFIGSANIDTNSRLCMASSVAGHRRAFGSDTVPGCYEDLDTADLLILVGSNAAWCHPVLYQRMQKNRVERGARIVVIDPRATSTAEECDLHLAIAPGMDSVLFSGLLSHLANSAALDRAYVSAHTEGFSESLARSRRIAPDVESIAKSCALDLNLIASFFDWFTATEKVVTLYSQGVNQSAQGTDKVNAIINCHLATGRIGRPGLGPFSLTGQPNAMGGREVGGLANQLAAHMDFAPVNVDRVRRFWDAPRMADRAGLKAVDLFAAAASGRIKALWVMATNPAVSLPRADAVRDALKGLEFLAVSEVVRSNDTASADADVLLPAAAWGEKDGTVTNSERRISRQRAFLPPPGEAQPDWWMVCEVAKRMGFAAAFPFQSAADIFREHAALSGFENAGTRDFDLGGMAAMSDTAFADLEPVQWPVRRTESGGEARLFADGAFFTEGRKARFIPVAIPALAKPRDANAPFLLNTGRVRDHWHTMTRTGKSPRLGAHIEEPYIEIHPQDARGAGLAEGGLVRVSSVHGGAVLRVRESPGMRRGEVFAPIHWNNETASDGRVGALVIDACDPFSGQPELKATPVALAPAAFRAHGFLVARLPPATWPAGMWWARTTVAGGVGVKFAASASEADWPTLAAALLGGEQPALVFDDRAHGVYRAAVFAGDRLQSCLYLSTSQSRLPGWDWIKSQLAADTISDGLRRAILAGRAPDGAADCGPTVCACFGVGLGTITAALASGQARCAETLGATLKAGTNCGSCLPELRRIVANRREKAGAVSGMKFCYP